MKNTWKWIRTILFAIVLALAFRSFLFASYIVDGKSMEPTLFDGNLLMVNKMIYDWQDVNHGDVIVFHANEKEDYVKRVIGLPGDTITYKNDTLYLNGKKVDEPYLDPYRKNDGKPLTEDFTLEEVTGGVKEVPDGRIFVMGDNRRESLDSRYFGFVPIDTIVGKVDVRYWPINQLALQF
ncbi:signal peptidase I [Pontibacillus marinus]|uniref:Signal peptidase I n=1 Tax=Pontibacillus marinus BH030004 = DSM 16465 TaxID=1385511 RepID=A0A0A5FYM3_9BACI|nr:signal peptidase I [Pontibacillus marinus]KGX83905.1 signal peptidase [Pontibacillus marinus BH030004 = DSM 16465]